MGMGISCTSSANIKEQPTLSKQWFQLAKEIRPYWEEKLAMTPTCKDFPRLASRIQIDTTTYDEKSKTNIELKQHDAMNKIVRQLASYFKLEEVANGAISSAGKILHSKKVKPDYEKYSTELLNGLGGDRSRVVRIIKSFHQNIIAGAIYNLKTQALKDQEFQDSRGPDSWRIYVLLEKDTVKVKHRRKELFMNIDGTFKWELDIWFLTDMSKLRMCQLHIVDLALGDKEYQKKLEKRLGQMYKSY